MRLRQILSRPGPRARGPVALALALTLACTAALFGAPPAGAQALSSGQGAASARSVGDWLERWHEASRHRAYAGTFVVTAGAEMAAARIWHVCDGSHQMERVETLTGVARTTLRRDDEVITFMPDARVALAGRREALRLFPGFLRTPDNRVGEFYEARVLGDDRIAGIATEVVELRPRDGWRFAYRVWSDRRSGLAIKLQTLDTTGQVLEQLAFSELQLDAPVRMDALARQMADTQGYQVQRSNAQPTTPESQGWRLGAPLPGFVTVGCHVKPAGASAPLHWVLSDGLASVSLFIEAYDPQRHSREGLLPPRGATHAMTRRLESHWVTAMGDVPPDALRRLLASLERRR